MAPPTTQPAPSSSACSASSTVSGPSSPRLPAEAIRSPRPRTVRSRPPRGYGAVQSTTCVPALIRILGGASRIMALSTDCRQPPPRSQPNRAVMTASRPIFWHRDRRAWLTAGEDLLAEDVGVASVAGEFLHHVHVHPAQGQGAAPVVQHQVVEAV